MRKAKSKLLSKRLTGQEIMLIAVAGSVIFWAAVLHMLLT
jgi:hypothetical protein